MCIMSSVDDDEDDCMYDTPPEGSRHGWSNAEETEEDAAVIPKPKGHKRASLKRRSKSTRSLRKVIPSKRARTTDTVKNSESRPSAGLDLSSEVHARGSEVDRNAIPDLKSAVS